MVCYKASFLTKQISTKVCSVPYKNRGNENVTAWVNEGSERLLPVMLLRWVHTLQDIIIR